MKYLKLLVLSISAMLLTACGRTEIKVNDYFSTKTEGANGRAKIVGELNTLAMVQGNREAFDVSENASESELKSVVDKINDNIEGRFDKEETLSNGDTVKFSWDTAKIETIESAYKHVKLVTEDKTVTVSGLKEIEAFNPFDYITLEYTYTASNPDSTLNVNIAVDKQIPISLNFAMQSGDNLYCGDSYVIEIVDFKRGEPLSREEIAAKLAEKGFELTEYEKEFKAPDIMENVKIEN